MSFLNTGRSIQRFLINQKYNTPEMGSIHAVLDARKYNTTIKEESEDFLQEPGKLRQLKLSFYPQGCNIVDPDNTTVNVCAPGAVQQPTQIYFGITNLKKSLPRTFYPDNLRLVDGSFTLNEHVMAQISSTLGALERSLASDITTNIVAHKGVHLDGSAFGQRVTMNQTTDGLITPVGYWQIKKEQEDAAYSNTFILGSTEVWNWKQAYELRSDRTTIGQDLRKIMIDHLYYDINLNTIMGVTAATGEYILTFDPEALKFVSWNRNAGIFATDLKSVSDLEKIWKSGTDTVIRGSFLSPRYNILWDFYANYVACVAGQYNGQWNWHFELNWDIVYPPVQTCNPEGVNGIMMYQTCPVVVPNCPTGTALSPAVSQRSFSWTPGSIYPVTVSSLLIGGLQSMPNTLVSNIADLTALLNDSYSGGATFTVVGSTIQYTGYTALTGKINSSINITFA